MKINALNPFEESVASAAQYRQKSIQSAVSAYIVKNPQSHAGNILQKYLPADKQDLIKKEEFSSFLFELANTLKTENPTSYQIILENFGLVPSEIQKMCQQQDKDILDDFQL